MTKRAMLIAVLCAVWFPFPLTAGDGDSPGRLEEILEKPPATGVLITRVGPGSQAAEAGMRVGDVIVFYGGWEIADLESLRDAKENLMEAETVEVRLVRRSATLTVEIRPGQIGINGLAVEKGVPAPPLPADTGVRFDYSRLADGPMDDWYAFTFGGGPKAGFEHGVLRLRGDMLILRREVAFDGGEEYGLNHFDVVVIAKTRPRLEVVAIRFENPLAGWVSTGRLVKEEGGLQWRTRQPEAEPLTVPAPRNLIPSYLVEPLAVLMPREEGACFRFVSLIEGYGQPGMPSALVCEGKHEIPFRGRTVPAWRYVWRQIGGTVGGVYHVGEDGRALLTDYGGPVAILTTREEALKDLHEELRPRSAR